MIPMSIVSVMGFLGFAASKPGKKDAQPSFSTLNNYVSAIKFSYKQANIPVSLDLNSQLGQVSRRFVCVGFFFLVGVILNPRSYKVTSAMSARKSSRAR